MMTKTQAKACTLNFGLFIKRARAGVHSSDADLIDHLHFQVVMNANLTRETNVIRKVSFHGQTIPFELAHLARVARENFDTAGGATSVATAAMENVDSSILDNEYQLLSLGSFNGLSAGCSYGFDVGHLVRTP
jgi:hypothetical protein